MPRNNSVSYQARTGVPPPSFACLPSSEISTTSTVTSLWPRQDDPVARLNRDDLGALPPLVVDTNASATLLDNLVCILNFLGCFVLFDIQFLYVVFLLMS